MRAAWPCEQGHQLWWKHLFSAGWWSDGWGCRWGSLEWKTVSKVSPLHHCLCSSYNRTYFPLPRQEICIKCQIIKLFELLHPRWHARNQHRLKIVVWIHIKNHSSLSVSLSVMHPFDFLKHKVIWKLDFRNTLINSDEFISAEKPSYGGYLTSVDFYIMAGMCWWMSFNSYRNRGIHLLFMSLCPFLVYL